MSSRRRPVCELFRPSTVVALLATAFFVLAAAPSRADVNLVMVVDTPTNPVAAGSTGSFDIYLTNTGSDASTAVAGYNFDLTITPSTSIQFTSVAESSYGLGYIFSNTGSLGLLPSTFPSYEVANNDLAISGGQVLNSGDSYGIVTIGYSVAANAAPGSAFSVSLNPAPANTYLSDPSGNGIAFTIQDGTITVAGAIVPEPSSLTIVALAGGLGLIYSRIRRTRLRSAAS
jgi:hypothetical protein